MKRRPLISLRSFRAAAAAAARTRTRTRARTRTRTPIVRPHFNARPASCFRHRTAAAFVDRHATHSLPPAVLLYRGGGGGSSSSNNQLALVISLFFEARRRAPRAQAQVQPPPLPARTVSPALAVSWARGPP